MVKNKSLLLELTIFSLIIVFLFAMYPERIESWKVIIIVLAVMAIAITIAKGIGLLMDKKLDQVEKSSNSPILWKGYFLAGFIMICLDFFAAFNTVDRLAEIPASTPLLFIISINMAAVHMLLCYILDGVF